MAKWWWAEMLISVFCWGQTVGHYMEETTWCHAYLPSVPILNWGSLMGGFVWQRKRSSGLEQSAFCQEEDWEENLGTKFKFFSCQGTSYGPDTFMVSFVSP